MTGVWKMLVNPLVLAACLGGLLSSSQPPVAEAQLGKPEGLYYKSWAIVIGIEQYVLAPPIPGAIHDAKKVAEAFRQLGFEEVVELYDKDASSPGLAGKRADTWHVRGNLFLTGHPWSSDFRTDDRGRNSGYSWFFNFNNGQPDNDPSGWPYPSTFKRALCVCGNR